MNYDVFKSWCTENNIDESFLTELDNGYRCDMITHSIIGDDIEEHIVLTDNTLSGSFHRIGHDRVNIQSKNLDSVYEYKTGIKFETENGDQIEVLDEK